MEQNTTRAPLLTEKEVAEMIGKSEQTLRNLRCKDSPLLSFVRIGRNIRYRLSAVEAFISENEVIVGAGD